MAKHVTTPQERARLVELSDLIMALYSIEGKSSQQVVLELQKLGDSFTMNQVNAFLRTLGIYRTRNQANQVRYAQSTGYAWGNLKSKECDHCHGVFTPTSSTNRFCRKCCPDKAARERLLKYGLSQPDYEALLQSQRNCCAICEASFTTMLSNVIHVDHDHVSGRIRGIVCARCNRLLVGIDNYEWRTKAITYVSKFSIVVIPSG